jgi:hypothetical protein
MMVVVRGGVRTEPAARSSEAGGENPRERRRFAFGLGLVVAGALLLRVLYVLVVTRHEDTKLYDSLWYEFQAFNLSQGRFFPVIFGYRPDAAHPPLTSIAITPVTYFFGLHRGLTPQRLTMAVLGALVVLCVGLLARSLAGPGVGLVAAVVAALYPNMWIPNGIVMSETLTMLVIALVLIAAYRLLRSPTWVNAALLGLGCGAEMLVRAEAVLLVPFLVLPAALACRSVPWRSRLTLAAVGVLAAGLTVGPWVGRNLVSFRDTTIFSTEVGPVMLGANCPQTYYGPSVGGWSLDCSLRVRSSQDQSVESTRQFDAAKTYIAHHLSRFPVVVMARVGRVWDLYEPFQMAHVDVNEGRPVPASLAAVFVYYALLPAAVLGIIAMRRHRITLWPLLVPAAVVTLASAIGFGQVRFRAEFEVSLVVLAATGIVAVWRWVSRRTI